MCVCVRARGRGWRGEKGQLQQLEETMEECDPVKHVVVPVWFHRGPESVRKG